MKIHHIKTGGTIGGCVPEYPEIEILASIFNDIINLDKFLTQSLKMYGTYTESVVCHKDSRQVTDEDRQTIVETIVSAYTQNSVKKFLVTHGTYTMPETAKYIQLHLPLHVRDDVQVLVTGSMFPWTVLGSDAPLNLGAAIGILLNTAQPSVSICMHGKLFDPEKVHKDVNKLIFTDEEH